MKKFKEEDFVVLRGPLESGRQSPSNFSAMFILSVFLQALMFFLTYVVAADDSIFPFKENLFYFHLFITGLLIVLSIIYAIPKVYIKGQKMQYLISILISQNLFGAFFYLSGLFVIGSKSSITIAPLINFTLITLLFGFLVFIVTSIRFYVLLKKGHYRKGSSKDKLRSKYETGIKSYLPIIIVGSIGTLFTLQYLISLFGLYDLEDTIMSTVCILLFPTMMFVLPEQLVILYCKYRFDSFNFNKRGELNPMGRKGA